MTSWEGHEKTTLDYIWEDVKENTNAPEWYKNICMKTLSARWRAWKYRVKANYYDKHETDEERMMNKPGELNLDWRKTLIRYWGKSSTKDYANLNRVLGHPTAVPRTGRISFPCIRHEMIKNNAPIDRPTMWRVTRRKKDGRYDENDGARNYAV
ncbi:hypothetical protein Droror1_Dr00025369 [Drosera rotundifolia]